MVAQVQEWVQEQFPVLRVQELQVQGLQSQVQQPFLGPQVRVQEQKQEQEQE